LDFLKGPTNNINEIIFSNDDKYVLVSSSDGSVIIWNMQTFAR